MSDIFLSYASEDRERVIPLVEKLESEGFSLWWDRRIGVGATFDIEIERELDAASCVIVVWSENSIGKEWVRDEATEGQERGVLVPVLIDAIRPPLGTRRLQTADLVGWPKVRHEEALAQLLASIRNYVAEPTLEAVTDPEETESDRIVIAVLPFDDRSPGGDMKYLCDGLAEDLMDALFHVEGLHVLSATDTFKHNQEARNIRDIGNALGATVVLEGGVQNAGNRIAITARLIQVESGLTLWSDRYLKEVEDAFEIQSDISNSVVEGLRAGLGLSTGTQPIATGRYRDPLAYDLMHQAYSVHKNEGDFDKKTLMAITLMEAAITQDPGFTRCIAELVYQYNMADFLPQIVKRIKIEDLVRRLESQEPDGLLISDVRATLEKDMVVKAMISAQAISRGKRIHAYAHPTGAQDVRSQYASALAHSGLPREALDYCRTVDRKGESNRIDIWLVQAGCHTMLGEMDMAIDRYQFIRQRVQNAIGIGNEFEALCRITIGDIEGAMTLPVGLVSLRDYLIDPLIRWKRGEHQALPKTGKNVFEWELLAYYHFMIGELAPGFDLLTRAVESGESDANHWLAYRMLLFRQMFDEAVLSSPQFQDVLKSVGLDTDPREKIRAGVAQLTPVTGIETHPLMKI